MGKKDERNQEADRRGKESIKRLCDYRERIAVLRKRIEFLEKKLSRLEKEQVSDVVKGGSGGAQHFSIQGFPSAEYGTAKRILALTNMRLSLQTEALYECTLEATEYLAAVEPFDIRRMLEMRYLDEMTWGRVAKMMCNLFPEKAYTEQSCRKTNERFFSS